MEEEELNYKQMVLDIDKLVETDFCQDMELKSLPDSTEYTQEDAKRMSQLLGQIYLIAHCCHCTACQATYITK